MIKAVVFDFDGTIADTNELILNSWQYTLKYGGVEKSDEEILASFGETINDTMAKWFPGREEECIAAYRGYQKGKYYEQLRAFPGMPELVRELKGQGIRLGVASSRLYSTLSESLRIFGIFDVLDAVVSFESTDEHKPKPGPMLKAMEKVNARLSEGERLLPQEFLYVGDSALDILCGHAAGAYAALVSWSAASGSQELTGDARPDFIVDRAEELLGKLSLHSRSASRSVQDAL